MKYSISRFESYPVYDVMDDIFSKSVEISDEKIAWIKNVLTEYTNVQEYLHDLYQQMEKEATPEPKE